LTVVLADGDVLDIARGDLVAHPDGWFDVIRANGTITRVPIPTYRMPDVPKCSAGYFAAPGMDLVDLFVGSEGTLGVVTEVTLHLLPRPVASLVCWLALDSEARGLDVTARLRAAARATWAGNDPHGLDVPAIESLDRRCIELLLADGKDREHGVPLHADDAVVLIFPIELHTALDFDDTLAQLAEPEATDGPAARLARLLGDDLGRLEVALPGEERKAAAFHALREAVPSCVNHRVRDARVRDPGVSKVAGDFVVPFERFGEALAFYREEFARRGLDHAIWGHASDGNVHPNVIPRDAGDVAAGKEALLALGERVIALGGSPLAEHGVGRHPVKQALLRSLYGDEGIASMRAVKRALDPHGRLAPGVLFPHEDA
jgi:D-lactate dehydrogenase (cytochrome)